MKNIVILGATGSIGRQALSVARHLKDKFRVLGLSSNSNIALLEQQVKEFNPSYICVGSEKDALRLRKQIPGRIKVFHGNKGLQDLASVREADIVILSVVGAVALYPLVSAIESRKTIALANKEALVIAGNLVNGLIKKHSAGHGKGPVVIPVDSEHSAIFQCLKNEGMNKVEKLIVTGSGGPFYNKKINFGNITVKQALRHPRWKMGKKITIDSATLMNKGLEIIEAHYLFGIEYDKIKLLIHPQSIIHSMVEFIDGSVIGLFSEPDMRLSIQYAVTSPERYPTKIKPLDLENIGKLEFFSPDVKKFPCLKLALEAARAGHTMTAVLNAANEVAVWAFLEGSIKFSCIPEIVEKVMNRHKITKNPALEDVFEADFRARVEARAEIIKETGKC
ncbi:MAG: 1-deoxy-D-xylulose-5-phosphate reductoisomerase [Elusimicrobia bacterium RIFOXYB2_FULL_48_7]|nr:MAG: 1-deoxy-D-xylulose-5-phosphate reductoisomerase [Elusimicrobia bacterium RIFOXYB2_FULL_48_7]